jgi:poly-gamma-glutamate synthesis protein (capsule biosynthesis protein)
VLKDRTGASGYAWINHPQLKKIIKEQKEKYENVIVFAHCGLENVSIPLPEWRELYHEIVDLTDSPFIATHPHIIQGYEEYKNNPICYSLGNFYFEKEMGGQEWNRSLLISIDTETGEYKIRPASVVDGVLDFDDTEECSKIIKERNEMITDGKLEERANQLAKEMWQEVYSDYYNQLIEGESALKVLKYLIKGIAKKILKRTSKSHRETMLLHNLQIETHRWVTERYLYGENKGVNRF